MTDAYEWSAIKKALTELNANPEYQKQVFIQNGQSLGHPILINQTTKTYVETLQQIGIDLLRIRKITQKCKRADTDYLYNSLVDVVYLMVNIDDSLKKGVPLHHDTIQDAVSLIDVNLTERLDDFYRVSAAELITEVNVAKDMRKTYEARRNALKTTTTKIETGA